MRPAIASTLHVLATAAADAARGGRIIDATQDAYGQAFVFETYAAGDYYRNKVAVVTGGASGIGLALAKIMLSYGVMQVVLADFNNENLKREAARLNAAYAGKVLGIHCNVTKEEDVQSMIRRAVEFSGRIDLLFNNAGAGFAGFFDKLTNEDWEKAFALNFYGALYGIRAGLPVMRKQGDRHIVNIISGIAFAPMAQQTMYVATKAARSCRC